MRSRKITDLTTGSVSKKLVMFMLPLLATNLLQHCYQAADNAVLGQFAGKVALAGVSSTGAATNFFLNILIGLSIGANIVNANLLGAKKFSELRKSLHVSITLAGVGGVLLCLIGQLISRPIMEFIDCPDNVIDYAVLYMRIIFLGTPGSMLYNFGAGVLRTHGDSKTPLMIMSICGLVNVVLNLIFVVVFTMTVDGVAYATIISKYISAAWVLVILFDPEGEYKLSIKELKLSAKPCMNIIKVGVPCGINAMVFSLSNIVIQSSVNSFGATVIAGNSVANNITALSYQFPAAIYSANISFAGQCYGADKFDRIEKLAVRSAILASTTTTLLSLLFTIAPTPFMRLFSSDADVLTAALPKLLIVSWSYLIYGVAEALLGILRGLKRTTIPTVINMVCVCGMRVFWVLFIFPLSPDQPVLLYLCYPATYIVDMVAVLIYFLHVRKIERAKRLQYQIS